MLLKNSHLQNYKVTRSKLHSTKENLGTKLAIKKEIKRKSREKIPVKHMWNALNLAITMSAPRKFKTFELFLNSQEISYNSSGKSLCHPICIIRTTKITAITTIATIIIIITIIIMYATVIIIITVIKISSSSPLSEPSPPP